VATEFIIPEDVIADRQDLADLPAEISGVPAALIMRVANPHIEVFIASGTEGNPYTPGDQETLADSGLYRETVLKTRDKLLVPDALADADWAENPDIKLNMISYLGFPILLPDSTPFGTIYVLDRTCNSFSSSIERLMLKLRGLIESHLAMLYMNHQLGDDNRRLNDYISEIRLLRGFVPICAGCKRIRDDATGEWAAIEDYLATADDTKFTHSICPTCTKKLYPQFEGRTT
jgi:hypothetical protein